MILQKLINGKLVVFDVMAHCGMDCKKQPYTARMAAAQPVLKSLSPLHITCKPFWPLEQISSVTSEWKQDGLIFMPEHVPVQLGMHRSMFKWKPLHTIDFALGADGKLSYTTAAGSAPIETFDLALAPSPAYTEALEHAPCIVECQCLPRKSVEVLHRRPDKTVPNFERTVRLTLRNIDENVQLEELVQCYQR